MIPGNPSVRQLALLIGFFLSAVSASRAQSDTAHFEISPIIVTASRVLDDWRRIPIAVTVVNVSEHETTKGAGIDEMLRSVPGLFVQSRAGGQDVRLSVRGFGSRGAGERSNSGTSRGVRVLLDGFPVTEPDGRTSFDLIDQASVDRIEVVRSNASTAWGNASGGVVNFITGSSDAARAITAKTILGSFGYRKDIVAVNSRIGTGNFSLTFTNVNSDGWRGHSSSTRSFMNARIYSLIGPASSLEVCLTAANNLFRIPGPLTKSQFDSDPRQAQGDTMNYNPTYVGRDERRFNRLGRFGARLVHEIDKNNKVEFSAFAGPKYLQRSERNTFRDFTRYHIGGSGSFSHRTALGHRGTHSVVAGVDGAYQDGAILFYNLTSGQRGDTLKANKREGARNMGAFVEDRIVLGDRYQFNFRLRYDEISYYYNDYLDSRLNDSKVFSKLTPMFGISVAIDSSRSIYGNIGGGVEAPAGNETDPPSTFGEDTLTALNPLLNPIRSVTYEIGTKCAVSIPSGGILARYTYDVAVYCINVSDDIIPYRGGRFYFTAGKTRRIGVEFGGTADLRCGVEFKVSGTLSRNRYVDYAVDSVHYGIPGKTARYDGFEMAGLPSVHYSMRIRYAPPAAKQLYCEAGLQGVGSYYADDANVAVVDAYRTVDIGIGSKGLRPFRTGPSVKASLGIENLFDTKYVASAFINPDRSSVSGEPIYIEPGLLRNWTASITVKWDL